MELETMTNPTNVIAEARKACNCLFIAVEPTVAEDVQKKVDALCTLAEQSAKENNANENTINSLGNEVRIFKEKLTAALQRIAELEKQGKEKLQ